MVSTVNIRPMSIGCIKWLPAVIVGERICNHRLALQLILGRTMLEDLALLIFLLVTGIHLIVLPQRGLIRLDLCFVVGASVADQRPVLVGHS